MIQKTFLPSKEDLKYFYKYSLKNLFSKPFMLIMIFPALYYAGTLIFEELQTIALFLLIFIVFIIISFFMAPGLLAARVLKQNVYFKHEVTILLDEEGVSQESYGGSSTLKWEDLYETRETKFLFVMYIMQNQAFLLPKRILSPEEIQQVSSLLKEKVPRRKKHWLKKQNTYLMSFY